MIKAEISTIEEEFEKSQVKAHVRTRRGKLERVKEFSRAGSKNQLPISKKRSGSGLEPADKKALAESKDNVREYFNDSLDRYNEYSIQSFRYNYSDKEVNKVIGDSVAWGVSNLKEEHKNVIPHLLEWASKKYRINPTTLAKKVKEGEEID